MKVVLTGGGTGGHIYPALSTAEAFRKLHPEAELLFVGSQHGLEATLAAENNIAFKAIPSKPLSKGLSLNSFKALWLLFRGVFRAKKILDEFTPDIVIGTGGYTSAAVVLAQGLLRRKLVVLEEQNTIPGRTNLWISRWVKCVCVGFEESAVYFKGIKTRIEVTGIPVRKSILERPSQIEARLRLKLKENKPVVLVMGGSQGAVAINEAVLGLLAKPSFKDIQILHLVGEKNFSAIFAKAKSECENYHPIGYSSEMNVLYSAADLVICRSGASTIAEITACALPAILIPYPAAYADHQKYNAIAMANAGAAVVIEQNELSADLLEESVKQIVYDSSRLKAMADASKNLGKPDAAEKIVRISEQLISE